MITTRRATTKDIDAVSELFNEYRMFYQQGTDLALAHEFISERLGNQESVIFIALNGSEEVLGFTQLYPNFSSISAKRTWTLNDLYVLPSARRQGVAKSLLNAARDHALETRAKGLALETAEDNLEAQSLYESLGYTRSTGFFSYFLSTD